MDVSEAYQVTPQAFGDGEANVVRSRTPTAAERAPGAGLPVGRFGVRDGHANDGFDDVLLPGMVVMARLASVIALHQSSHIFWHKIYDVATHTIQLILEATHRLVLLLMQVQKYSPPHRACHSQDLEQAQARDSPSVTRLVPSEHLSDVQSGPGGEPPLTERSNLAIHLMLMMELRRSFRIARMLGLLAVLLTAGLGQHVHAAKADPTQAIVGDCVTSEHVPGEQDAPGAVHCGFCHAVRAMLPAPESLSEPVMLASRQVPVESTPLADTLPSGVPSPPPRRRATA